jgi:beta-galactosidase
VIEGITWADEISPTSAKTLVVYDQGWLKGMPAITIHSHGKGSVVYVGTLLRGTSLSALLAWLCQEAGVKAVLQTPSGVRAYERRSAAHRLVFLLNFGEQEQVIQLDEPWEDTFTGKQISQVDLALAGVAIIRRSRS